MKLKFLLACSLGFSCQILSAASVGVDSGDGADFLIFETADGGLLSGGLLSVGAFEGTPSLGLGLLDVQANFRTFDSQSLQGGFGFGDFDPQIFEDDVEPSNGSFDFRGQQIYALVTNSNSTEFAFFTADNLGAWLFPTVNDGGIDPNANDSTDISLNQFNNIFAGIEGSTGTSAGVFVSIQLIAVPEPSSTMFLALSSLSLLRRRSRK